LGEGRENSSDDPLGGDPLRPKRKRAVPIPRMLREDIRTARRDRGPDAG